MLRGALHFKHLLEVFMIDRSTVDIASSAPAPAPGNRRRGEARREELVRASYNLLVERGFEGFRVREVAQRAGVNIATLHYYFPTKEDLIRAVVASIVRELDRVPTPDSADDAFDPGSYHVAVRAHIAHVLRQMHDHPDRFAVLNELFVRSARDTELHNVLTATDASWRGYLEPMLTAGIARGEFRSDLDAGVAADLITTVLKGLTLQPLLSRQDRERIADHLDRWLTAPSAGR